MRMGAWVLPAAGALVLWGCWGLFQKLTTMDMPTKNVYLIGVLSAVMAGLVMMATGGTPDGFTTRGIVYALLACAASAVAALLFLVAVGKGSPSLVITFTALYPLVTILLSYLVLRESISGRQGMGIVLALLSMVLLAG